MNKATATWILGILGWVISYALFLKWLAANRWDFFGGWAEAFTASDFSTGLIMDLSGVTVMLVVLALWDRRRLGPKWTAAVIASLALSVSVSLAIYPVGTWRSSDVEKARDTSAPPA